MKNEMNNIKNLEVNTEVIDDVELITVVIKMPGEEPEVATIYNRLKSYQKFVDGFIESVPAPFDYDNINIVMNDEGKIRKMGANIFVPEYKDIFAGPILAVGVTDDLTWRSLTDKEIDEVLKYFKEHSCFSN